MAKVRIVDGDLVTHQPIFEHGGLIVKGKLEAPKISCSGLRAQEILCHGNITSDKPIESDGDISASGYISCGATISAGGNLLAKQFIVAEKGINAQRSIISGENLKSRGKIEAGEFVVAGVIESGADLVAGYGIFSRGHIWSGGLIEAKLFVASLSEVASGVGNCEFPKISVGWDISGWGSVLGRCVSGLPEDELWRFLPVGA